MAQPRKRKQPKRKPKSVKDDDALSGWTIETKPVELVRLRPVAPTLWRDNLKRLRKDFLYARKQHGPLRCPLFQDSTSKADAQQPPFDLHAGHVGFHSQLYHDFRWHVTADRKPIYLKHPIVDVKGTPIVDSQGRGLLCEMPTGREWSYCGTSPGSAQFRELAERAGRALLGSARHTIAWIPPDTLFTPLDEHRWLWAAFDLAWQGRHPSLRAERKTWYRPRKPIPNVESNVVYVPYDRQQLRSMREGALASVFNFPKEWTERLPGYFISELPDLFQASADLIDTLLDLAEHADGKPAQVVPAQARVARPTWERLEIIEQRSGNDLAILDGQEYRLPSKAADLLIALQEAKGQMVLADTLTKTCGKRADHIYRSLPDELRPIIDAPGKTGQGYRMK